jgi:hypothetical protein
MLVRPNASYPLARVGVLLFGVCACLMDGGTTLVGLQHGQHENNPVVASLVTSLGSVGGVGLAVALRCAAFTLCVYEMQQPRWKRWQIFGFAVTGLALAAMTWLVVVRNFALLA